MRHLLFFGTLIAISSSPAFAQCYKNGIPCGQTQTATTGSTTPTNGTTMMGTSNVDGTSSPVLTDAQGRIYTTVFSLPALSTGNNPIGSITNTTFGSTQSGNWTVNLGAGGNVIGSIANTNFGATQNGAWNIGTVTSITNPVSVTGTFFQATQPVSQSGTWSFNLGGNLPDFAHVQTVNLGSLNGAATESSLQSLITALGSPLQTNGVIGNTSFGSTQSGDWHVGLDTGTNVIGSIGNTSFGSSQNGVWNVGLSSGTNTIGSVNINGTVPVSGSFYQSVQPISQSGSWTTSLTGNLPAFTTPPTVNLGTLNGIALDTSVKAISSALGNPFQAGGSIGNTSFGASQAGAWSVGITGTLPSFASPQTVNLGTLNGAATDATLQAIKAAIGTPFQAGTSIANSSFGAAQLGSWTVGLAAGTNTIGNVGISSLPALPSGSNVIGSVNSLAQVVTSSPIYVVGTSQELTMTPSGALRTDGSSTTQPVSAVSLPLPVGAATEASLAGLSAKFPSLGAKAGASSISVVANTDTPLPVSQSGTWNVGSVNSITNPVGLAAGSNVIGGIANTAFALNAGSAIIGKVGIDQTTPGTSNGVVVNSSALPTGAATASGVAAVVTALGSPLQAGGNVTVSNLPSNQTVSGTVTANIGTTNGLALDSSVNTLFKAGQSIGNTSFGISGSLPAGTNTLGAISNSAFALNAGSAIIGKIGIDQTTPGTTNGVVVNSGTITTGSGSTTTVTGTVNTQDPDVYTAPSVMASALNTAYTVSLSNGQGTAAFSITGLTASGATLSSSVSDDKGATWYTVRNIGTATVPGAATFTSDGIYAFNAAGHTGVRLVVSTAGSGNITIGSNVSTAVRSVNLEGAGAASTNPLYTTSTTSLPTGTNTIGTLLRSIPYNETTTALSALATFTGTARDSGVAGTATPWNVFSCFFLADQSGTAKQQASNDGTTWFTEYSQTMSANVSVVTKGPIFTRYHRCQVVNGATLQTSLVVNSQLGQ